MHEAHAEETATGRDIHWQKRPEKDAPYRREGNSISTRRRIPKEQRSLPVRKLHPKLSLSLDQQTHANKPSALDPPRNEGKYLEPLLQARAITYPCNQKQQPWLCDTVSVSNGESDVQYWRALCTHREVRNYAYMYVPVSICAQCLIATHSTLDLHNERLSCRTGTKMMYNVYNSCQSNNT